MIRFGKISEFDAAAQAARVTLPDDGIVTDWLPILSSGVKGDKYNRTLSINEVVCIFLDENANDGAVLGSVYDLTNAAPGDGQAGVVFDDGGKIYWSSGKLTIEKGLSIVEVSGTGIKIERAGDSLKSALSDLITQIQAITVISTTLGAPSSPPVNAAAISAIAVRIQNILQ